MSQIKEIVLCLYWTPACIRTIWKHVNGGFFVFREECDEFLRFVIWAINPHGKEEWMQDYHAQCVDEIAMRQRRGEWKRGGKAC